MMVVMKVNVSALMPSSTSASQVDALVERSDGSTTLEGHVRVHGLTVTHCTSC